MKTISTRSTVGKEEFYLSQTEDYSPEDSISDSSGEQIQRSMIFSTVYVLSEQRTSNKSGIHSFKVSRRTKQTRSAGTQ